MFTLKLKDMYILVSEKDIKSESVKKAYHERMPDGRLIMTPQELKMLGSVPNVQIVSTARELKELMKKPVASDTQTSGGQTGDDGMDSFFTGHGADTQTDGDTEEEQQGEADESGEAENANTDNIGEEDTEYGTTDTGRA